MARKADFSNEEWEQLQRGAAGAVLLVSTSDPGLFETFKEARAAARHFSEARDRNTSDLVGELAQQPSVGFGLGMSPQELETETLDTLRGAAATLRAKAPDELDAYRTFVLDVARSVAEAAEDVAAAETGAIAKIRAALDAA